MSPLEVRAVTEARSVLQQFAAGKVTRHSVDARNAVFDRMAAELARQRQSAATGDLREFADADPAFHATHVEAAQNGLLHDLYGSVRDHQTRTIGESAVRDAQRLEAILAEHTEIAEAVRDSDVGRLLDAIKVHLAGTERALAFTAD